MPYFIQWMVRFKLTRDGQYCKFFTIVPFCNTGIKASTLYRIANIRFKFGLPSQKSFLGSLLLLLQCIKRTLSSCRFRCCPFSVIHGYTSLPVVVYIPLRSQCLTQQQFYIPNFRSGSGLYSITFPILTLALTLTLILTLTVKLTREIRQFI